MRVDLFELRARLREPLGSRAFAQHLVALLRRGGGFLERARVRGGALRFARRDGAVLQQRLVALRIGARELELRVLRFPVLSRRLDLFDARAFLELGELCGDVIATRLQLRRFELHDDLAGFQRVAFMREDLLDATAHARRDVHFIDLDRAGDSVGLLLTTGRRRGRARRRAERATRGCTAFRIRVSTCKRGRSLTMSSSKSTRLHRSLAFMAGYSGTPLVKKLGIRPNEKIVALNAPEHYEELLDGLPDGAVIVDRVTAKPAFVHLFVNGAGRDWRGRSRRCARSWTTPEWSGFRGRRKSAKVPTDVTEDTIREVALPLGFVDVKVCAVDEKWSGLKLMIRRENRAR